MSDLNQSTRTGSDDTLEVLLRQASPRPVPSPSDELAARQAVRSEWRAVTRHRRSRRRWGGFAIAATLLIVLFSVSGVFRAPGLDTVQVATIEKSFGSIYLLGESSELRESRALTSVHSGQTIVTGDAAGIALAWGHGGSLRLDANTRITFTDDKSVYLESGRLYFDSAPSTLMTGTTSDSSGDFVVESDFGEVYHLGTQFMTRIDDGDLRVSVREGQVRLDGHFHKVVARSGQQVTLSGRERPVILTIRANARDWAWVGRTSPPADVDGKSIHEFIEWVQRETGFEAIYEGHAEQVARAEFLKGTIDAEPMVALQRWMSTTGLDYSIDEHEGVIYVGDNR